MPLYEEERYHQLLPADKSEQSVRRRVRLYRRRKDDVLEIENEDEVLALCSSSSSEINRLTDQANNLNSVNHIHTSIATDSPPSAARCSTSTVEQEGRKPNRQSGDDSVAMLSTNFSSGPPSTILGHSGWSSALTSRTTRRPLLALTTLVISLWLLSQYLTLPSISSHGIDAGIKTNIDDATSLPILPNQHEQEQIIVTLASSAVRLQSNELAITLRSLLQQNYVPHEIRIYIPDNDKEVFEWHRNHKSSRLARYLKDETVQLHFIEDVGPSTKFFYAIEEMLLETKYDQAIVVVDDDHSYSPDLISSLASYAQQDAFKQCAIGLRGWRVRSDLHWGVAPEEMDDYTAEGWRLAEAFRVGVLTANEGYLIRPRFFINRNDAMGTTTTTPAVGPDTTTANLHKIAPILDKEMLLTTSAHLVDDIWMNGHLARAAIPRYVVPLRSNARWISSFLPSLILASDAVPSIDVTKEHTLEGRIQKEGQTRATANWATLRMFEGAWRLEKLFYVTLQERRKMTLDREEDAEIKKLVPTNLGYIAMTRRRLLKLFHHIQIRMLFGQ